VIATNAAEPLHPVIALVGSDFGRLPGNVDTAVRDGSGQYARHIAETMQPPAGLNLSQFCA
jgi:hypothetical protein